MHLTYFFAENFSIAPSRLIFQHGDEKPSEAPKPPKGAKPEVSPQQAGEKAVHSALGNLEYLQKLSHETSPQKLEQSAREAEMNKDNKALGDIARNQNISNKLLQRLSVSDNMYARRGIAANKKTGVDILKKLAGDKERDVKATVAANQNTPPDILKQLASDQEELVRAEVASNLNTPQEQLQKLALEKPNSLVLEFLAMNPKLPTPIAMRLLKSDSPGVLNGLIVSTKDPVIAGELLKNPKLIERAVREYRFELSASEKDINSMIELYKEGLTRARSQTK